MKTNAYKTSQKKRVLPLTKRDEDEYNHRT